MDCAAEYSGIKYIRMIGTTDIRNLSYLQFNRSIRQTSLKKCQYK